MENFEEIRDGLVETFGKITSFWGFSKVMGQLYGVLYLSPTPLSLTDLAEALAISKAGASINLRNLEQWGMARKVWIRGDRRDHYEAEIDFWQIVRGVLRSREKKEFSQALSAVETLQLSARELHQAQASASSAFVVDRLAALQDFIKSMDRFVNLLLTLEDLSASLPWFLRDKGTKEVP